MVSFVSESLTRHKNKGHAEDTLERNFLLEGPASLRSRGASQDMSGFILEGFRDGAHSFKPCMAWWECCNSLIRGVNL